MVTISKFFLRHYVDKFKMAIGYTAGLCRSRPQHGHFPATCPRRAPQPHSKPVVSSVRQEMGVMTVLPTSQGCCEDLR